MILVLLTITSFVLNSENLAAQDAKNQPYSTTDEDAFYVRSIMDTTLSSGNAYNWLYDLCTQIGHRLAGSPQGAAAVEHTYQILDTLHLDSVWLQPVTVPHWVRGKKESVRVVNSIKGSFDLKALALGNSLGSGMPGVQGEVIEVKSFEELEALGKDKIKGKIVFFNRPFDATTVNTFHAYSKAADQRVYGASKAAKFGAVAVLVRSMASSNDDVPHTGSLKYDDEYPKIPAVGISTNDANLLSDLIKAASTTVYVETYCHFLKPKISYNVIGEIKGSESPNEIILVGGHLDSWDVGQGAHDDGAGCVQSMQVLETMRKMGYHPKHTIRCVLFANEENGLAGGKEYAEVAKSKNDIHLAAIESDEGGFTPRGFSFELGNDTLKTKFKKITSWADILEPYGLTFDIGGSGADISPLRNGSVMLIGLRPDSQRYFHYHHTDSDRISAVDERELKLGAGAISMLVYLIDKYGL
ncbi:MAG: M20/M25/M40 family metallo-hydrolase [Saprospiraceae bacterium]|nr:M20/M25/M40 family metallo-hydrolase [Saprospiraceae bacterium]